MGKRKQKHGFGGEKKTNAGNPKQEIRAFQDRALFYDEFLAIKNEFIGFFINWDRYPGVLYEVVDIRFQIPLDNCVVVLESQGNHPNAPKRTAMLYKDFLIPFL